MLRAVVAKFDFDAQHEPLKARWGRDLPRRHLRRSARLFWGDDAARAEWGVVEHWGKITSRSS